MSLYRNGMVGLALAALALAYGCAPAMLGDTTRPGTPPTMIVTTDFMKMWKASKANVVAKGENLDVTVTMENGETCVANLKLKDTLKSAWFPLYYIPGYSSEAQLIYDGKWASDLPAACLTFIQAPGGTYVEARVGEYHMLQGGRSVGLITKMKPDDLDISAKSSFGYVVPTVKGVDD